MQSENINELAKALAAAQAEIEDPHKTKTGKIKGESKSGNAYEYSYKYADIADVLKNVRACLSRHGIAVTQPTMIDGNALFVQTKLMHESGQWMASDYPVCSINGDHQKMGGALTYSRRYSLCSMVGVAADDDTDAQGAAEPAPKLQRKSIAQQDKERPGLVIPGVNQPGTGRTHSAEARRQGGLDYLDQELIDCGSALSLQRLREDYERDVFPRWPRVYQEPAEMKFDARLAEFSTGDDLEQTLRDSVELSGSRISDKINDKAEYIRYSHDFIENAKSSVEMKEWHAAERNARTRLRLSREEAADIIRRMTERNNELKADAPWGRDKGGNALTPLSAG